MGRGHTVYYSTWLSYLGLVTLASIDWESRWPNFSPQEILSPHGQNQLVNKGNLLIQPHALDFLQSFRNFIDKPFLINHAGLKYRGYRGCKENLIAGGVDFSYHIQGLAFDVSVPDVSVNALYTAAVEFGWKGVGAYETFVHMDLRSTLNGTIVTWSDWLRGRHDSGN